MIWACMGPDPAPLFPNYDLFVWDDVMRDIGGAVIPCNWLQVMENSLDPVHAEWLHTYFSNYALERLGRSDLKRSLVNGGTLEFRHAKIAFDVFEHGIIKKRLLVGMSEEDDGWAVGHPIIFPNILRVGNAFQMRGPVDDTHTYHWWYTCHKARPGFEVTKQDSIPFYEVPVPTLSDSGEPIWPMVDNNSGQDIAMWYTQGDVADRTQENLGLSDKGVNLYRRMLEANVARVKRGEDPMNVFRDPAANEYIEFHTEQQFFSSGDDSRVARTGQAGKYSPILQEAAKQIQGEEVLAEPVH